jgi:hypothetical protein
MIHEANAVFFGNTIQISSIDGLRSPVAFDSFDKFCKFCNEQGIRILNKSIFWDDCASLLKH